MATFTITQVTRENDITKIMNRATVPVYHVSILQFLTTVDLVDHVIEVDTFRRIVGCRPDHCIRCVGHVAGLAITVGVMPVFTMQGQVGVAVLAQCIVHDLAARHWLIISHGKHVDEVLHLVVACNLIFLSRVDRRRLTAFDAQ